MVGLVVAGLLASSLSFPSLAVSAGAPAVLPGGAGLVADALPLGRVPSVVRAGPSVARAPGVASLLASDGDPVSVPSGTESVVVAADAAPLVLEDGLTLAAAPVEGAGSPESVDVEVTGTARRECIAG